MVDALSALGSSEIVEHDDRVTALSPFGQLTFQKVGEIFLGRVDRATEEATSTMLTALQGAVGSVLQQRSAETLRVRASELGLRLIEDRTADGEVRLVFEEIR